MSSAPRVRIGTAGWSLPREHAGAFASEGDHLQRYSRVLPCAEINVSFYRAPRAATYARWAASTPAEFRFSVKAPRTITHEGALAADRGLLSGFLEGTAFLGEKRGPLLFQLPPKQAFDAARAEAFLQLLRELAPNAPVAFEPRHATWFNAEADALLRSHRVARVGADPARVPEAAQPGGDASLRYVRLHGSPRIYYSRYEPEYLQRLATELQNNSAAECWCIFDNTASGAALGNALELQAALGE